ncbi:hypothetical protein AB4254_11365 [Vibrio breoganii]
MSQQKVYSEQELVQMYVQFQSAKSNIDAEVAKLNGVSQSKKSELANLKAKALEEFGTSDVAELTTIYQRNLEHNSKVIPEALERANDIQNKIKSLKANLGIQ